MIEFDYRQERLKTTRKPSLHGKGNQRRTPIAYNNNVKAWELK